ncbi:GumC family protein [Aureimonas glaciei]|uniref:GumC family protein n=1 Tax=Aureimonas glaciei TaxID=1776957 RepID=UPI001665A4EF|nr:Wzz/FepE/Etk N-terminal domain-containing protein [Aureimonas glaciei]
MAVGEERRRSPRGPVIDPVYVAKAVWNSKLLIVATTILGLGLAVALAISTPKRYTATTQILMDPRDLKVVANEITPNGLPSEGTLALVESQTAVIMSSNILSRVIAKADLEADPEFNGTSVGGLSGWLPPALTSLFAGTDAAQGDREYRTLERLRRAMTVSREAKSFVINLSVESTDPEKAARIANLTSEVFIAEQGRVQSDTARRATDSLSSRLAELRQSVVRAESAVEDYKSQNALIGVGGRLVDDEYITRTNDRLARARGDITALRVKADSMRSASVEDVVRGTLPEELASEALVRLRQTYAELAQQQAVLGTKLGPRHPQRIASEGALTASRQAIAGELQRIVAAAQTELARAEATERDLTAQLDELKDKQVTTSGAFVKLRELEREVDASRAVYEAFLLRARETGEQESLNTANVRVISEATPPLLPSSLSRKTVVVAGGLLGFLAGIGIAGLAAMFRLLRAVFADRRRQRTSRWGEGTDAPGAAMRAPVPAAPVNAAVMPAAPVPAVPTPAAVIPASETPVAAVPVPAAAPMPAAAIHADGLATTVMPPTTVVPGTRADAAEPRSPADTADVADPIPAGVEEPRIADAIAPSAPTPSDESATRRSDHAGAPGRELPASRLTDAPSLDYASAFHAGNRLEGTGLTLADAGRTSAPEVRQRASLRDRVRAIAAADAKDAERRDAAAPPLDPTVATLRDEIETVKQAIADIRRRRELTRGS